MDKTTDIEGKSTQLLVFYLTLALVKYLKLMSKTSAIQNHSIIYKEFERSLTRRDTL